MKWKGDGINLSQAVHGVEGIEIPQFTVKEHRAVTNVENLATGKLYCISADSLGLWTLQLALRMPLRRKPVKLYKENSY